MLISTKPKTKEQILFGEVIEKHYGRLKYKVKKFTHQQNVEDLVHSSIDNFFQYNINHFDGFTRYSTKEDLYKGAVGYFYRGFFKYFKSHYGKKIKRDLKNENLDVSTDNMFYGLVKHEDTDYFEKSNVMGRDFSISRPQGAKPLNIKQTLGFCIPMNFDNHMSSDILNRHKEIQDNVENKIYLSQFIKFFNVLSIESDKKKVITKFLDLKYKEENFEIDGIKKKDIFGSNFAFYKKVLDMAHKKFDSVHEIA